MEEVHVDQVEGRAPQAPPCPQVPLAGPAPLGKVRERELALFRQPGSGFRAAAAVKVADARVRAGEEVEVPLLKGEDARVQLPRHTLHSQSHSESAWISFYGLDSHTRICLR